MRNNRLFYGFLFAAAAFVSSGVVWIMQPARNDAHVAALAPAAVSEFGTVDANPFAKGDYLALPAAQAQAVETGTGVFRIDDTGRLVLDGDTRIRLDMLISALPANATMNELQDAELAAVAGLPQAAAKEGARILRAYVSYSREESGLNTELAAAGAMTAEAMLDRLVALRHRHLGPEIANALFAEQERDERYGVRIAMLESDPKLTIDEKLARMEALQHALPADAVGVGADIDAARAALLMEQEISALRRRGAAEAEVRQLRERQVGPEAAKAIVEMAEQKTDWERRQQTFIQQKNAIMQIGLGEQQERDRIEALLSQLYSEEELPAARASHQIKATR